eukprot:376161_1
MFMINIPQKITLILNKHSPKDNTDIKMNTDAKNDEEQKKKKKHIARPKLSRCETLLGSTSFEAKDPQTLADIVVQQLIEQGIHSQYPNITIKGEENLEEAHTKRKYMKDHCIENIKVEKTLPIKYRNLLSNINIENNNLNLNEKDIILWIDPVDGTKCFTLAPKDNKAKKSVTCLIGIVYKSRPIAGIINCPFNGNKTYFSIVDIGVFGVYNDNILNEKFLKNQIKRDLNRRYIAASMIYDKKPQVIKFLNENCKADAIIKMGGAGNKILSIILGECDAYVKISRGTRKWDICAPEAFILAIGGILTDKYGDLYSYDKNVSLENVNGVIATWTTNNEYHNSYCQKFTN